MTLVFDFYRHDFPIAVVLTLFFLVAVCWVIGAIWLGHEQQKADDRAHQAARALEAETKQRARMQRYMQAQSESRERFQSRRHSA